MILTSRLWERLQKWTRTRAWFARLSSSTTERKWISWSRLPVRLLRTQVVQTERTSQPSWRKCSALSRTTRASSRLRIGDTQTFPWPANILRFKLLLRHEMISFVWLKWLNEYFHITFFRCVPNVSSDDDFVYITAAAWLIKYPSPWISFTCKWMSHSVPNSSYQHLPLPYILLRNTPKQLHHHKTVR